MDLDKEWPEHISDPDLLRVKIDRAMSEWHDSITADAKHDEKLRRGLVAKASVMQVEKSIYRAILIIRNNRLRREADLEKRLAAVESRLADIQTRGIRYRGYFQPSQVYHVADMVTFGGSLWHCNEDGTTEKPAETPECTKWTLAARKGRDAKGDR